MPANESQPTRSGEHGPASPQNAGSDSGGLTPEQWRRAFKPILRFTGVFVLIIALLSIPWPGTQSTYRSVFIKVSSAVFGSIGPSAVVLFSPLPVAKGSTVDISMNVGDRTMLEKDGTLPTLNQLFSSRYMAFLPTVLLVALIVATPLPWKRRLWSLVGGLFLIHLFIAFEVVLMILYLTNHAQWMDLFELGSFGVKILDGLWNIFVYQIAARFFVPVMIWILVTFRAGDLNQILGLHDAVARPMGKARRNGSGKSKRR